MALSTRQISVRTEKPSRAMSMKQMMNSPGLYRSATPKKRLKELGIENEYFISLLGLNGLITTFYSVEDQDTFTYLITEDADVRGYPTQDIITLEFKNI